MTFSNVDKFTFIKFVYGEKYLENEMIFIEVCVCVELVSRMNICGRREWPFAFFLRAKSVIQTVIAVFPFSVFNVTH